MATVKIGLETLAKVRKALPGLEGELVASDVLNRAFSRVKPEGDWKGPINTTVDLDECPYTLGLISEAIEHITATRATYTVSNNVATVRAKGYRAGPAGP